MTTTDLLQTVASLFNGFAIIFIVLTIRAQKRNITRLDELHGRHRPAVWNSHR